MNPLDLLFGPIPQALCAMFEFGFIPREDDFLELTPEQYRRFDETQDDEFEGKLYMVVSHDPSVTIGNDNDIYFVTENDKNGFMTAVALIENMCKDKSLNTDEEKLRHAASVLPEVFTRNSKYSVYHNMKLVKPESISK